MQALPRIYSIQALRAVAAILVVLFHARTMTYTSQQRFGMGPVLLYDFGFLRDLGAIGVDIFFVISGFIMTYITWNEPRDVGTIWPFLRQRLARIVPVYWFYTLIMAAVMLALGSRASQIVDLRSFLWSLSFIPYTPTGNSMAPVLAVGWTLSYEMYFYVLVALGIVLPRRVFLIGVGAYFALSVLAGWFLQPTLPMLALMMNPQILEFYFGMLICAAFLRYGRVRHWIGWSGFVIGLVMLIVIDETNPLSRLRGIAWGLPAAGVVLWFLAHESRRNILAHPVFQALGASSYSLYLSHTLVLLIYGFVLERTGMSRFIPLDLYLLASVAVCIISGHILYLVVELPLVRFTGKMLRGRSRSAAAA